MSQYHYFKILLVKIPILDPEFTENINFQVMSTEQPKKHSKPGINMIVQTLITR